MPTIFDNIVKKEKDHTSLLQNLMERHPLIAAAAMSLFLGHEVTEEAAVAFVFRAQAFHLSDLGREIPDLVVEAPGLRCLIEVKVDPALELTTAQRAGYRSCFPEMESSGNTLCLLVPNEWRHVALKQQVRAVLPEPFGFEIVHWRQLIKRLETAAEVLSDAIVNEAVRFWKQRFEVEAMTSDERRILNEWSGDVYGAVSKLQKTVTQAKALFDARGWRTELETDTSSFGFYIKRDANYLLWVGVWNLAPAPLCMGFIRARAAGSSPRTLLSHQQGQRTACGVCGLWNPSIGTMLRNSTTVCLLSSPRNTALEF